MTLDDFQTDGSMQHSREQSRKKSWYTNRVYFSFVRISKILVHKNLIPGLDLNFEQLLLGCTSPKRSGCMLQLFVSDSDLPRAFFLTLQSQQVADQKSLKGISHHIL